MMSYIIINCTTDDVAPVVVDTGGVTDGDDEGADTGGVPNEDDTLTRDWEIIG